MDARKKIAVFTANIYEPMVRSIQEGINKAAAETNVKVIYFTSFSDSFSSKIYTQYQKYDEGDVVSFILPDLNDFDGAVRVDLSYGTYTGEKLQERLSDLRIPVINVGGKCDIPNYYNILNDEVKSFTDIVEHVITEHGCEDLYHVAGIKGRYFTDERIDAFKAAIEKHGIPFDQDKVFYGTLWRDCGEDALDYILGDCAKRGKKYPDAILCANDYSAIGVVNACRSRGIEVPGDIIVTGYDGVEEAYQGYPSLTTSAQPFYEAGYESVYTFLKLWDGQRLPKDIRIRGTLMRKQSCGCEPMSTDIVDDIREIYQLRMDKVSYLAQSTTNLILSVSNSETIDECFDEISKNGALDTGFEDMLLCLAPGWDQKRIVDDSYSEVDEDMRVVAGFIGDKKITPMTFRKKDLLPPKMLADPKPYYIFPIHHLQYYMGYLIVSPRVDIYDQLAMKSWIVNLGSMLENWRIRQELRLTLRRMENMYNRDMLTNLYNRHGYEMFFEEYFRDCFENKLNLAVLMIDMDDLKYINDTYGHAEGDYSLCTIANAMNAAAQNDEICLRTGGDEFVVLARNYSDAKVNSYTEKLRKNINDQVKADNKEFTVQVSVGACVRRPVKSDIGNIKELSEDYMRIADTAMYEQKKAHKAQKNAN